MGVIARKKTWLAVFVALLTVVAVSLASLPASMKTNFHSIAHADPKGIKYLGVGACGGNGCHSEDIKSPKPTDKPGHDESTIWEKNDGHARAFDDSIRKKKGITLKNKDAAKIAKAMKIADPTAEARCLACHALTGFSNGETKARIPLDFTKDVESRSNSRRVVSNRAMASVAMRVMGRPKNISPPIRPSAGRRLSALRAARRFMIRGACTTPKI